MNKSGYTAGRGRRPAVPDKVDMSLDDIIKLNRKEQQLKASMSRRPVRMKGRLPQGKGVPPRAAGPQQRGGALKQRNWRVPQLRRGQGVVTGLAARRPGALLKRVGPLSRTAISQKTRHKTRPFVQHTEAQYRRPEVQRWMNRQPDPQRGHSAASVRRPFQLRRRPLPPVQQMRREARQATFLFRRGLSVRGVYVWTPGEVQAQVPKQNLHTPPVRTRQWRTSTASNGILTVSIDNPTARTQPEPPTAWTLHPPAVISAPVKVETEEKKIPKGVPLQFDINSVGKPQTSMTLNERFRILKDQRTTTAQSSKGSRFVTVG